MSIRLILMDIEGTTTDINFVHKVLFPYSAERMIPYVEAHGDAPDVRNCLQGVKETVWQETREPITDTEAINVLLQWIREDRKHPALKKLQGLIWKEGFEQGAYQGHVYPEVPACLEQWKRMGLGLGIYSSGSVQAQKLLFAHSIAGDLTPYFSHYFDTAVGGKKEAASYQAISKKLDREPEEILFLSDVEAELQAASETGFNVTQVVRPGTEPSRKFPTVENFKAIQIPAVSV